jgi:cell division ATPase FtsA
VKIGIPSGFSGGLVREIENPAYATAVGLIYHGLKHRPSAASTGSGRSRRENNLGVWMRKVREFFDAL